MSDDFYSLVQRRIWNDAGFRKLSKPAPNARDLFLYLLTTPSATQIPGLLALGESAMAEDLGWPVLGLRKCLAELEMAKMVKVDRAARLLWLPNGLKHNPPRSPDNVKGWAKHWRLLPECALLREAAEAMMAAFAARGPTFAVAFGHTSGLPVPPPKVDPKGTPKVDPKPAPYPAHQIQDQDQDPKQENFHTLAGAHAREDQGDGQDSVPVVTHESLLAAVERHEMLSTLHGDRKWATRVLGALQGAFCRAGDVDAAVNAFVADNAAKAPEDGPSLDDFVRDERNGIGRYLKNAKQCGDQARQQQRARGDRGSDRGTSGEVSPDVDTVLRVFGDEWSRKKRKPWARAVGDEKAAAAIVERAREEADKLKMRPRDIVKFWAEKHVACTDRFVVESDHALRTLGSQLTTYGLPPQKKPATTPPREPEPVGSCAPPPDLGKLFNGPRSFDGPPPNRPTFAARES